MMKKRTPHDYKFLKLLGEGSFSSVYLAVDADVTRAKIERSLLSQIESGREVESGSGEIASTNRTSPENGRSSPSGKANNIRIRKYAIKVCQKTYIKRQGKQMAIMREKEIMNVLNQHPNEHFIRLYCTFQDLDRLYFVMTYAENGELLTYMQEHPLSLINVQKYTLQLLTALEHIHKLNIVHRDLKPENILLNEQMNILLTDFGSAQIYSENDNDTTKGTSGSTVDRRNSFVGTAQYVSPEMLKSRQASNKSDLWALGAIIYQMLTNTMLFNAPNEYLIYQKIQNLDYEYPDDFNQEARDLIDSLVKLEPLERRGALDDVKSTGYVSIRHHSFLSIDEDCLMTNDTGYTEEEARMSDPDLMSVDKISPGLDETQLLRLLTTG